MLERLCFVPTDPHTCLRDGVSSNWSVRSHALIMVSLFRIIIHRIRPLYVFEKTVCTIGLLLLLFSHILSRSLRLEHLRFYILLLKGSLFPILPLLISHSFGLWSISLFHLWYLICYSSTLYSVSSPSNRWGRDWQMQNVYATVSRSFRCAS